MPAETVTELSQRDEAFWLGFGALLTGAVIAALSPQTDPLGAALLGLCGIAVLTLRLFVGIYRIARLSVISFWSAYRERRPER